MTQQLIGVGAAANDGTGDLDRAAWIKTNANFTELYGRLAARHVGRGTWGLLTSLLSTGILATGASAIGNYTATTGTGFTYATTNYGTTQFRVNYVSAATAGAFSGIYLSVAREQFFTVASGGLGGGLFIARFMVQDTVALPLMFVGLTNSNAAPVAATDPSTFVNCIGFGTSQTVTNKNNLQLFYGGSAAQTPIDLGANFPVNTNSADFYEVIISSDPVTGQIGYTVNRYTSSTVPAFTASGTITNTTPGTTLPASSSIMGTRAFRSNNGTAAAVTLAVQSLYLEGQS